VRPSGHLPLMHSKPAGSFAAGGGSHMDVDEFDRAGGQGIGRLPHTVQCYVRPTTVDIEPFIISYIMLNRHTLCI
jgi:hypothetical protein